LSVGDTTQPRTASSEEHEHVRALFERGGRPAEAVKYLVARGHAEADALVIADRIDDEVRERRYGKSAPSPQVVAEERAVVTGHGGGARGVINIIIGVLFVGGGASGSLVLKGTESSGALAVVGLFFIGLGVYRLYAR
jgi:hypothetical protein